MGISYCVTVCDEFNEFHDLMTELLHSIDSHKDNIIVLLDLNKTTEELKQYLNDLFSENFIQLKIDRFQGDFADWKNKFLNDPNITLKDYLIFLDADEIPSEQFIKNIHTILEVNPDVNILGIPRINKVNGIMPEHLRKWRWSIDENGRINYPDFQYRIMKNLPEIKWVGKVHETLMGPGIKTELPIDVGLDLIHIKDINKQEQQNKLYNEIS